MNNKFTEESLTYFFNERNNIRKNMILKLLVLVIISL